MRVALFITCFNDTLFPEVGRATVRLLRRLGQEVEFPDGQTCCGQLHFNTGYRAECVPLVHRFVDAFSGYDAVVTPSPSCAAMVRHHHATVASEGAGADAALADRVAEVAPRVYDLSEFLVDVLGVIDVGASFPHPVTFHPTCHSMRLLRIGDRPQRLLAAVRGISLLPLPGADECCGFGGTFAVKNAGTSLAMGVDKVNAIAASGAEVVAAADTSCLMHIGGLLSRSRSRVRAMHVAEILAAGQAAA
ncbi:MAG: (Fe-S)-binding protein [Chloroflexota bacterium]|nr:(Fe-S)-binding protein [Chloroflexota bacterium]